MTMIKRIARAMLAECERQAHSNGATPYVSGEADWLNDVVLDGHFDLRSIAQAALEAMINEGAISERMNSDGAFQLFTGERIDEHSLTLARQCFRAMLKAAIAER